jgi:GTP-binding protein Era
MSSERSGPNRPCGLTTPIGVPNAGTRCKQSITISTKIRPHGLPHPRCHRSYIPAIAGGSSVGATPVPIPNTVVKPYSADGTPPERARESRPLPAPPKGPLSSDSGPFYYAIAPARLAPDYRAAAVSRGTEAIFWPMTRAGIVTVVGKPNVGKSTLLNRVVGTKLSIVSDKPQSTRDRVVGIRTQGDVQMILLDTPGLLHPRYALQEAMRATAIKALEEADAVLYLVDATVPGQEVTPLQETTGLPEPPRAPVVLAFNKSDLLTPSAREAIQALAPRAHLISATSGDGVDTLFATLGALLPESPFLYPEDEISTQTVRFFVSELIRETALEQLEEEVPYSIAAEIEEYREAQTPIYIRAVVYVERESQKRILIGAGGRRIRSIGRAAREKIEAFVGAKVFLDLWVKVLPNWRRNANALQRLGFRVPQDHAS